jgi:hypothetical protein
MTLSDMQTRVLDRVGEIAGAPLGNQFYTPTEATAALNAAQRLFVLLTLCLETSGTLELTTGTPFYSLLTQFPGWLVPLRIRLSTGAKLKPARLAEFAALDNAWSTTTGTPSRYALLGFDFLAPYPVPSEDLTASVTFASCPAPLALPTDTPAIPAEYHPALIDGAIPLMRVKEGGQELQKTMPYWNRFLDEAQRLGDYVRARNQEQGYDHTPFELRRFDRSKVLMQAKGQGQ